MHELRKRATLYVGMVAFLALWITAWKMAFGLSAMAGATYLVCAVIVERRERRRVRELRAQIRTQIAEAARARFAPERRTIGAEGYGAHPSRYGMAFLVYGDRMHKPLLKSWTVRPDEYRRVAKARWS